MAADCPWNLDDVKPGCKSSVAGDFSVFPRLETSTHDIVFQVVDTIRYGRGTSQFLGVVVDDSGDRQLLCVSDKAGSAAKIVLLKRYSKPGSTGPDQRGKNAFSRWVAAKKYDVIF